jgi:4-hydroxybenzoate polyprenyltransferase
MLLDWLKLVRAIGLITILTNIIAAVMSAIYPSNGLNPTWLLGPLHKTGFIQILWLVGASFLLYLSGMLWNDLADVGRDKVLHPRRPLPSGRINLGTAFLVGVLLAVGALVCAAMVDVHAFYAAGAVLSLIMLYNLVTKDIPWLGSLTMAAVRGSHALFALLLLGTEYLRWAVVGDEPGPMHGPGQGALLAYPLILTCYIFGVTLISELESRPGLRIELLIGGALMFGAVAASGWLLATTRWITRLSQDDSTLYVVAIGMSAVMGAVLFCLLLWRIWRPWSAALKSGRSEQVGPVVGAALGGMIFLDALVATAAHPLGGVAILCLLPIFLIGKRVVRMD